MIEVIYKEEKKTAQGNDEFFHIPKNIRQIGLISDACKIYVEDYVYTFLGKIAAEGKEKGKLALLLGQTNWKEGVSYLFVRCALEISDTDVTPEHIGFTEEVWKKIQEEIGVYFQGQQIIGWFFSYPGIPMEITQVLQKVHQNHFGGSDKILFLMEPAEKEDAIFRYENGYLNRQPGYYIYYEKNPLMQAYMIEKSKNAPMEPEEQVADTAIRNVRKIIQQKKVKKEEESQRKSSMVTYAATACVAIAALTVGINFVNNYQKMEEVTEKVEEASVQSKEVKKEVEPLPTASPAQKDPTPTPKPEISAAEKEASDKNQLKGAGKETMGKVASREESDEAQETTEKNSADDAKEESEESSSASVHESYVIQPGDTLFKISMERYHSMDAMKEICELNDLSLEEIIYPGQIIVLP